MKLHLFKRNEIQSCIQCLWTNVALEFKRGWSHDFKTILFRLYSLVTAYLYESLKPTLLRLLCYSTSKELETHLWHNCCDISPGEVNPVGVATFIRFPLLVRGNIFRISLSSLGITNSSRCWKRNSFSNEFWLSRN